jgi:prevent-host-death family protein
MRTVSEAELKKNPRKYLAYVKNGEEVVICQQGLPVAKLVPVIEPPAGKGRLRD